jgi:ferredoxin-NADP reductase
MVPVSKISDLYIYIIAGTAAMLSKYILTINKKHIFNPAAFGLVIIGLAGLPQINWWVGNSHLFPFVLVLGLIVVRKIRKLSMFSVYFIAGLLSISFFAVQNHRILQDTLIEAVMSYPILFLGAFMLVEPLTTPPRRREQLVYGAIVGILSGAQYHMGPIYSTPELGLLIGNVYSFVVSFRKRLALTLDYKKELVPGIFEFSFLKNPKFNFQPGEYLEWTLGGVKYDLRGQRRFFSIASAPTENDIKIGIKISEKGSNFKSKLATLKKGDKIFAGNLAGDFLLTNRNNKYVFMAGGIGITPFRSMVKNAVDKNEKLDAILFYSCSEEGEFVYREIFESAEKIGLKTIYVCSHPSEKFKGVKGRIDANMLKKDVPDFKDRTFYLSGPNVMVNGYKNLLRGMGIRFDKIVTDYFSGY